MAEPRLQPRCQWIVHYNLACGRESFTASPYCKKHLRMWANRAEYWRLMEKDKAKRQAKN